MPCRPSWTTGSFRLGTLAQKLFRVSAMNILAHRGLVSGPDKGIENRLDVVEAALAMGFGLETDIRFKDGVGYISHDPLPGPIQRTMQAMLHCSAWSASNMPIALNFKELGTEEQLASLLHSMGVVEDVCIFDMELVEDHPGETALRLERLLPGARLASRASDRDEPLERALALPGRVVWMDEMDHSWIRREHVDAVHAVGKQAWMVLPDLHGGGLEATLARLGTFSAWGADAVCTDWGLEARRHLERTA